MLDEIWKDQKDFNKNFFPPAEDFAERSRQTKEFVLHMMSELDELLRATVWKLHRRTDVLPNREQVKNELTDILKYLISLYLVWDVSPEEALQDYWRKSMVVRQRYAEEYVKNLDGKIVLVDIDGVLADYVTGFIDWISQFYNKGIAEGFVDRRKWMNAVSMGLDEQVWQELKHQFRTRGGKRKLPLLPMSKEFLDMCRSLGYKIVLLTSRPIDRYPNIYTDTLEWLKLNNLPFDFIWWSLDKAETVLSKNIRPNIVFAVDDDLRYVTKYSELGIKTFWITDKTTPDMAGVERVPDLRRLMSKLQKEDV